MAALPRPLSHYAAAAASRWLLPEEILDLLTHAGRLSLQTSGAAPDRPPSGACYLFDRRVCRRFRADGHGWTSRGDSNRVREDHVRLRVDGTPRVAAAHAHHADDPQFHRRTYQLIDEGAPLSLVHYRPVLPREAGEAPCDAYRRHAGAKHLDTNTTRPPAPRRLRREHAGSFKRFRARCRC